MNLKYKNDIYQVNIQDYLLIKKEIIELSENLLFICALLRRPWRWDYDRD